MGRPEIALDAQQSAAGALGAALRRLRHAAGLTQTELAGLIGCDTSTVGQVERARFLPSAQLLETWEAHLQLQSTLVPLWERAVLETHRRRAVNGAHL